VNAPGYSRSLSARSAWALVALVPALWLMCLRDHALPARLALVLLAALLFESVALLLRRQPLAPFLREGSWLVIASVLVLCDSHRPLWQLCCALFVALVLSREAFGGLGRNLFQPVAVGACFLVAIDPGLVATPAPDLAFAGAGLVAGSLLVVLRIVRWQAPVFLLAGAVCGLLATGQDWQAVTDPRWWLAAIFVAGDPGTSAEDARARSVVAAAAGLAAALAGIGTLPFALLATNAATPLIDGWRPLRPRKAAA
jgi:Na+-translocating ferredoxin:NAD+ oxidoreductase RnfD subunit